MRAQTTVEYILLMAGAVALVTVTASVLLNSGATIHEKTRTFDFNVSDHPILSADFSAEITDYPPSAVEGNTYPIWIRVCNSGPSDANYAFLLADSKLSSKIPATISASMSSGECNEFLVSWRPQEEGNHTVTARVVTDAKDPNMGNNGSSVLIYVQQSDSNKYSDVNAQIDINAPDVSASFISYPDNAETNKVYTLALQLCNEGNSDANCSVTVSDNVSSLISPNAFQLSLHSSECNTVLISWTPLDSGTHTVSASASVDPMDRNTSNNSASVSISVSPVAPAIDFNCSSCSECTSKINQAYAVAKNTGTTITVRLTQNISSSGTCISLSNKNYENLVVFDGQGHTIIGSGSGNGVNLSSVSHIEMKNFTVTGFENGIYLSQSSYNRFTNVSSSKNTRRGIAFFTSSSYNILENATTNNNGLNGISIAYNSNHNFIRNVTSIGNGQDGVIIYECSYTVLKNAVVKNNKQDGVAAGTNNLYNSDTHHTTIDGVESTGNARYGIYLRVLCGNDVMRGINVRSNGRYGVRLDYTSNSYVDLTSKDSFSCGNGGYDVYVHASSSPLMCLCGGKYFHYGHASNVSCSCHKPC